MPRQIDLSFRPDDFAAPLPHALSVSNGEYDLAHAGTTNDGACMPAGALAGWPANKPDHPIDAPDREWLDQMVAWLSEAFVSSTWYGRAFMRTNGNYLLHWQFARTSGFASL
jgi:hypothetical protein